VSTRVPTRTNNKFEFTDEGSCSSSCLLRSLLQWLKNSSLTANNAPPPPLPPSSSSLLPALWLISCLICHPPLTSPEQISEHHAAMSAPFIICTRPHLSRYFWHSSANHCALEPMLLVTTFVAHSLPRRPSFPSALANLLRAKSASSTNHACNFSRWNACLSCACVRALSCAPIGQAASRLLRSRPRRPSKEQTQAML